jgi:DNA-directed RNA polymerase specialized sigma24 family protein
MANYVNNKTLYEEMKKYKSKVEEAQRENKQLPQIPNYVGQCFLLICNKLATRPNFIGYSYKDEMIADGIENCVTGAHSFDPSKSVNPFAYFTQIAWNAFIRRIQKEKKQAYIKHKNFEYSNLLDELIEENHVSGTKVHNEYSDDIIRNFEDKLTKKTKKSKIGVEKFIKEEPNEEEPATLSS